MEYNVYNERNIEVIVDDEMLQKSLEQNGKDLSVEIISAMGISKDKCYSRRLEEALYHEKQINRIKAMYSLLSMEDKTTFEALRKKESSIPDEDLQSELSEKSILQAVLIRLQKGADGVRKAFFTEGIPSIVKTDLLYIYAIGFSADLKDIEFLIDGIEVFAKKSEQWMKKLKKDDFEDIMMSCLDGLLRVSESSSILSELPEDTIEKLSKTGAEILKMKIDSYAKEVIATFARALPPKYAYEMLEPIMNRRAKGDVKKELNASFKILKSKE
ncbi:MAG: hypothetical protein KAZ87_12130 [Spirochaetes bacterium]|nr:hypothetical protein [Spirochaetota bacterium]